MAIWKTIPILDGKYEASDDGRVRKKSTQNELYQETNKLGYKTVKIQTNYSRKHYRVHRLVAFAFLPNPNNYDVVNHKDENPSKNCLENLEWCTQKYNSRYGTLPNRASKSHSGKPCQNHLEKAVIQYDLKMNFIAEYESILSASKATGIDKSNIKKICTGKTKKPRKYIFKFKEEENE